MPRTGRLHIPGGCYHLIGRGLERLISKACNLFKVSEGDLMKKSRANNISKAKAMICYWGIEKLGFKAREIADRLELSQPAVSKWIVKGRQLADDGWVLMELNE